MPNINLAYQWAINTCNQPNVGYSQTYRRGQKVNGITYYDCSSFISAALTAGGFFITNPWFSTASMRGYLQDLGFTKHPVTDTWLPGDILWKTGHTEMCYQGYTTMGAHQAGVPLADQVSINSGPISPTYYEECWRYEGGASPLDWIKGNRYLNQDEMQNNAYCFWSVMYGYGWTLNAASGALGCIQHESTINPGIWQSLNVNPELGFGLVQATPSTKMTGWLGVNGYDNDDGNGQCRWIHEQTPVIGQWIPTADYPETWEEFISSTKDPAYLSLAWINNYERPGVVYDPTEDAKYWYKYLEGMSPIPPGPGKSVKRKCFKFPILIRRRRV